MTDTHAAEIRRNAVTATPAADASTAAAHAATLLGLETDCWDVHESLTEAASADVDPGFVLVDVRGPGAYDAGHVAGALHRYHTDLDASWVAEHAGDRLIVVYCAGPHCNGADKAMLRLAGLGHPVKKMIGGVTGWLDEGFDLTTS